MVQSAPNPLSLDVVPVLSDMSLTYGSALSAATDDSILNDPDAVSLVLYPGDTNELMLRLRNETDHALYFVVDLRGSLPLEWCQTSLEPQEVQAGERLEVAIAFQVPVDFFETLTDAAPAMRRPLNYSGRLEVYSYNASGEFEGVTSDRLILLVRPHSPYTQLLPQVYQEVDLVGRLMAIVERTFSPDVETWFTLWAHLNPLLAPQAMLGFLAHWVGWRSLPQLTWEQQRRLIHRAFELYAWRGTAYGLRLFLHLATGLPLDDDATPESQRHISILEPSRQGAIFGDSTFDETTVFGGSQGFQFRVVLRPPADVLVDESLVRTIIEQERPAFCTYELSISPLL